MSGWIFEVFYFTSKIASLSKHPFFDSAILTAGTQVERRFKILKIPSKIELKSLNIKLNAHDEIVILNLKKVIIYPSNIVYLLTDKQSGYQRS